MSAPGGARGALMLCIPFLLHPAPSRAAPAVKVKLSRGDSSNLVFYAEGPQRPRYPFVLYVPGGGCRSVRKEYRRYKEAVLSGGAGLVAAEKRGFGGFSLGCPKDYVRNNTVGDRVLDYMQVVEYLRRHALEWDGRLFWMSSSEAGKAIASLLSGMVPETRGIILLGCGGGMSPADEVILREAKELDRKGAGKDRIERESLRLRDQFAAMLADPQSLRSWGGRGETYRWWSSLLVVDPMGNLEKTNVPVYIAQGTEDRADPVESADMAASRLKALGRADVTYVRYEGLDHDWRDAKGRSRADTVLEGLSAWLRGHN